MRLLAVAGLLSRGLLFGPDRPEAPLSGRGSDGHTRVEPRRVGGAGVGPLPVCVVT